VKFTLSNIGGISPSVAAACGRRRKRRKRVCSGGLWPSKKTSQTRL
jgi:hypothetical protein